MKTSEGTKYLLCDGSEIPSSYPKLRSLMTHTPDLRDRVPQGAGAYAVNTAIEAALPNVTGYFFIYGGDYGSSPTPLSGPFYSGGYERGILESGSSFSFRRFYLYFDSSRCSAIYKNDCTTVQPPALAVTFYIKAK